jgi:hypothetical protein
MQVAVVAVLAVLALMRQAQLQVRAVLVWLIQ